MVEPLLMPLVVTLVLKLPAGGLVDSATVRDVAVAEDTMPTAPESNTTVLFAAVVSKPSPTINTVDEFASWIEAEFARTTGATTATVIAEPLLRVFVVTVALSNPAVLGLEENTTVSEVALAAVIVPTAPSSSETELFPSVLSNPKPWIVTVVALAAIMLDVFDVTTGLTLAICTAGPLASESVVTTAVRVPATSGSVENVIVNSVVVAAVTMPTAPSLNATVLSPTVVSKPKPWMTKVLALAARLTVLLVTTGRTVATWIGSPLKIPLVETTADSTPAEVRPGVIDTVS